jgi:hypothetical protein
MKLVGLEHTDRYRTKVRAGLTQAKATSNTKHKKHEKTSREKGSKYENPAGQTYSKRE